MIAFAFSFPAGRYHATPWGRHANEADVAWPPEPVRILRALIATWWRKTDHERFPKTMLDGLIDALAAEPPVFRLPDAVHTHVRAFMPAPTDKKLIYDAFLRFNRDAELIVAWPGVTLTPEQETLAAHLLEQMGYLGRSESWAEGRIAVDWTGHCNTRHRTTGIEPASDTNPVEVAVPLTPVKWADFCRRTKSHLPKAKAKRRDQMTATLPDRIADALAVETARWQAAGWSSPPPMTNLVYDRPAFGSPISVRPFRRASPVHSEPDVARFILTGRPRPRIEDTLKIAEIARLALMSGGGEPPQEFSGRGAEGALRADPAHAHAFFLPEDADGDGLIDHLCVYSRLGFSPEARRRLDRLARLWLAHGRADEEGDRGRKEWRLALEDIASAKAFGKASRLIRPSRRWASATPYLMPWYAKRGFGPEQQIRRECERRGVFPTLSAVEISDRLPGHSAAMAKRAIQFHRFRSRRGLVQPDTAGCFATLTFDKSADGPVALGFACHFGLGLFTALD